MVSQPEANWLYSVCVLSYDCFLLALCTPDSSLHLGCLVVYTFTACDLFRLSVSKSLFNNWSLLWSVWRPLTHDSASPGSCTMYFPFLRKILPWGVSTSNDVGDPPSIDGLAATTSPLRSHFLDLVSWSMTLSPCL